MKFSVLLPTRNRLELLVRAIETVRRQHYENWEIIVSDNCSEEDVAGYVASLDDSRIKYFCTESFVPVTDNWNNALEKCDGDYIIMLGDDDGLMKGYFSYLVEQIRKFDFPDFVYTSAFLYAYPGVLPNCPKGFLRTYNAREIYHNSNEPFLVERFEARNFVKQSLNFRVAFDYNMQFSLVSSRIVEKLKSYGPFYQSPYPDYYASNAIMQKAEKILVVPKPLVTVGISPKSFGYYYFNDAETKGTAFLKNFPNQAIVERLKDVVLPGTNMNTSWLFSMETLAEKFNLEVNYARYRELQIRYVYAGLVRKNKAAKVVCRELKEKMSFYEIIRYHWLFMFAFKCIPKHLHSRLEHQIITAAGSHPATYMAQVKGDFDTILDVFETIDPQNYHAA